MGTDRAVSSVLKLSLVVCIFIVIFTAAACVVVPSRDDFNGILSEDSIGQVIFNRLYFVFSTLSTCGYGDMTPRSPRCKIFAMLIMIVTILGAFIYIRGT